MNYADDEPFILNCLNEPLAKSTPIGTSYGKFNNTEKVDDLFALEETCAGNMGMANATYKVYKSAMGLESSSNSDELKSDVNNNNTTKPKSRWSSKFYSSNLTDKCSSVGHSTKRQQTIDDDDNREFECESMMMLSRNWSNHSLRDITLNPNPIGELAFGEEPIEPQNETSSLVIVAKKMSHLKGLIERCSGGRSNYSAQGTPTNPAHYSSLELNLSAGENDSSVANVDDDVDQRGSERTFFALAEYCEMRTADIREEQRRLDEELIADFQKLLRELGRNS